jgi:hypothetical protein
MMKKTGRYFETRWVMIVLFFLVCFILTSEIQGKTKVKGVVTSIRDGKLERFKNNSWNALKVREWVFQGERLRTDNTAVAIIEIPAIGRFVIGPSSEIELGEDPQNFQTKMDRGFMWLKSGLPKGSKASITTTLATAGIRGTGFAVCDSGKYYCACTCFGEVEVTLKNGQAIKVPKGEYIDFTSDSPIPEKTQPAASLLEKTGTAYDFCFNCHVVGGKGKLK